MGRRKKPRTLEELNLEMDYYENELRKNENEMKLAQNSLSKQARKERTRRLCREAGVLEHYVPELKEMDEQTAGEFIRIISTGEAAEKFLNGHGIRNE